MENLENGDEDFGEVFDDYEAYLEDKFSENEGEFEDFFSLRKSSSGFDKFDGFYAEEDFESKSRGSEGEEDFDFYAEKREQRKRLSALAARLNLISRLKELREEEKRLKIKNGFLHKKCKDYLGKYKITSYFEKSGDSLSIYGDERYKEILEEFETIEIKLENREKYFKSQLQDLEFNYEDRMMIFDEKYQEFLSRELEIASECLEEKYATKKTQNLQKRQGRQLERLIDMRVKFFKMKSLLERIDNEKESLNDFGEGKTVNHYTNLLVTKNRLAERLDEREEDAVRVRRKILALAPILSHVKETAHGVNMEIEVFSSKLDKIDELNRQARSLVVEKGRKKDLIRRKYTKLYQTAYLLMNPKLLQVLMNSADELKILREKIENSQLLLKQE